MPLGLHRYHASGTAHFITFSSYKRAPLLVPQLRDAVVCALEKMRVGYHFRVYGYVVMPEHVHIMISEPEVATVATVMQALKVSVAKSKFVTRRPLWQIRYYDHNVRNFDSFWDKLLYMHRNPVKRELVVRREDWPWSSYRHYKFGEIVTVEIESPWTQRRRLGLPLS